ncbi:l-fucose permease [Ophiostoma piceae UAMH 11346]|uniref:L-fucose permease n=1 Tax=Ophiostoma piceae (strain UAMH 11346) TaxID=1262450 RepID=S3CCE2_OPHP1|nr:l-fucose permease [Ophiostoma piceae UAMH 11346]
MAGFPDRGPAVLAVTTTTLILGSLFVLARMVCRLGIVRRFGWDDYFIAFAWLIAFGLSLTINLAVRNGLGRHDADIVPDRWTKLRLCEYVFSILYNPALMATKTSILVFYIRLSKNTQDVLRWGSYGTLAIVNLAGTVLTFMNIFQCRPVAAAFSPVSGRCIPLLTEFICSAPVNIVTDLAILSLPIPVLTGMRLPPRQKTILVFTFALGIFVTVVDVVRVYYLQQAINTTSTGSSSDPNSIFGEGVDFSWNASLSFMWSAVEVNIGITCACIPTLKPLIIKILPAMLVDPDGSSFSSSRARDPVSSDAASRLSDRFQSLHPAHKHVAAPPGARLDMSPIGEDTVANGVRRSGAMGSDSFHDANVESTGSASRLRPDMTSNHIATADHAHLPANTTRADDVNPSEDPQSPLRRPSSGTRHVFSTMSNVIRSTTGKSHILRRKKSKDKSLYFGFVKLHAPKNMLEATPSESFKYCTMVAVLFFLWGFSYGLLNTLNNVIAAVSNMTTTQTLGLTSAYFGGGYLFGPLVVGEWILRHDEHHRRRSSSGSRGSSSGNGSRGSQQSRKALHSVPTAAASAMSHAATAVIRRSASSSDNTIGGFKATFIVGLCFYGIGTIMFWPSSVLTSFPGFLISNFVVGFGLSILETAANPFIILCGPLEYAEVRLLFVQGAQGIGSVLSGLLAQNVFFVNVGTSNNKTSSTTLLDVQWTYLAVTLFCVALALFFYYMPLPELPDSELELAASRLPVDGTKKTVFGLQLRTACLLMAIVAQWTYVASQESMSIYFHDLMISWLPDSASSTVKTSMLLASPLSRALATTSINSSGTSDNPAGLNVSIPNYMLVCRTAFAVSRLFAGLVVYLGVKHPQNRWLPSPRMVLLISSALMVLFGILIVVLKPQSNANLIVIPMSLFFFAEGPIFPLIFAIGLRGQGARTKRAAAFITMGTSGPLFWPYVMFAILKAGGSIRIAFVVVVSLMAVGTLYPIYLTFAKDAHELTKVAPLDPSAPRTGCGGGPLPQNRKRPDPNELNDVGGLLQRTAPVVPQEVIVRAIERG